jgi:hypothetical protein
MNHLPNSDQFLHVAEIASSLPLLGALLLVSLPVLLPLVLYRWIHGPARPDAD